MAEMRTSKIYGDIGRFHQVRPGLHRSESGRVHLLGRNGIVGGKGEGAIFLDHAKHTGLVPGYDVPRSLILCEDFSGVAHQPLSSPIPVTSLDTGKVVELIGVIGELGFSHALAIRSSAQIEDQIGHTAAGAFDTGFHAKTLDTEESRAAFTRKLLDVYNSAYSEKALKYWRNMGFTEIPPLSVVIQEVVGCAWQYAPTYFMPAISGITNTSQRRFVKTAIVLGLGLSAVSDEGLGRRYRLSILEDGSVYHDMNESVGEFNPSSVYCLDINSGNVVQLRGQSAEQLFPEKYLTKLEWDFPETQVHYSQLALAFERALGFSVDLEWAREHDKEKSLVQIRPIAKRPVIERPQVTTDNILLKSNNVLGYGEKVFDHVIYIDAPHGNIYIEGLVAAFGKYPNSLIIYRTEVIESDTARMIHGKLLPYSEAVVVLDSNIGHMRGTGMQHLALNLADDKKIIICLDYREDILIGSIVVETFDDRWGDKVSVLQFKNPVHLVADDDFDLGMLYLGE